MERLFRGVSIPDAPPSPRPRLGNWSGAKECCGESYQGSEAGQTQKVNALVKKMWGILADCSAGVNCVMWILKKAMILLSALLRPLPGDSAVLWASLDKRDAIERQGGLRNRP